MSTGAVLIDLTWESAKVIWHVAASLRFRVCLAAACNANLHWGFWPLNLLFPNNFFSYTNINAITATSTVTTNDAIDVRSVYGMIVLIDFYHKRKLLIRIVSLPGRSCDWNARYYVAVQLMICT